MKRPQAIADPVARYAEIDRSFYKSTLALALALAVLAPLFRSLGLALVFAGWMPITFHLVRLLFVRTETQLYRWGMAITLVSGCAIVVAAKTTGGITSPALIFTIPVGLVAATLFLNQSAWVAYAPAIIVAVGIVDASSGGPTQTNWFYTSSVFITAVASPRLARDAVDVELAYRAKAVLDPLTGCLNRSSMAVRMSELQLQAQHTDAWLGVVAIDIDHFKTINDRFGHSTGDVVLQQVAYTIRKALHRFELLYRTGGEEFVLLLPGAAPDATYRLAETVRVAVEEAHTDPAVTISLGVAAQRAPQSLEEIVDQADQALLAAKRRGRNQTVNSYPLTA